MKIAQLQEIRVRECAVTILLRNGAAEPEKQQVRVRYFSPTIKQIKERQADIKARAEANPDEIIWLSETLAQKIDSLPDFTDDNDQPVEVTAELLDKFSIENLEAIRDAIEEDLRPKKTSNT